MDRMEKTTEKRCPRTDCGSTDVHYVSPGGTAGFGSGQHGEPLGDIWECRNGHPFLLAWKPPSRATTCPHVSYRQERMGQFHTGDYICNGCGRLLTSGDIQALKEGRAI